MILLVSGEGVSDIGRLDGEVFIPGLMCRFIDQLTETVWGYSPLAVGSIIFLPKRSLATSSKERKKSLVLRSLKKGKGTAEFHKNAQVLALHARELAKEEECPVGCVLFRDSDGVRSSSATRWQEKWDSMEAGFKAQGCERGVPMLPKPKSEIWILCALKKEPYLECDSLENLPGNDKAEGSPKKVLEEELERQKLGNSSTANLNHLLEEGRIDALQINMPSYNAFKKRLLSVTSEMVGKSL